MPTTTYTPSTFAASVIGARTDSSGTAVTDLSAEEARVSQIIFGVGYLQSTAFKVAAQATPNMSVLVGSGTAKADYYVLQGAAAGQGNYLVRLDATSQTVTISAADASQTRTDEVYLVVRDNLYDTSGFALPEFGYRKGDLGGANPGPDATWKAYSLLARVTVAPASTSVVTASISDQRTAGGLSALNLNAVNALTAGVVNTGSLVSTGSVNGASVSTSGAVTATGTVTGGDVKAASKSVPRGIIARVTRTSDGPLTSGATPATAGSVMSVSAALTAGRRYRIYCPTISGSSQSSNVVMTAQLTYTLDGSTPTGTSTRLATTSGYLPAAFSYGTLGELGNCFTPGSNLTFYVLLSVYTPAGANAATFGRADAPLEVVIEDIGADPGASGTVF